MNISDFDYDLPEGRIAWFPLAERDASKLLVWRSIPNRSVEKCEESAVYSEISETVFEDIGSVLPTGSLLVFNNTRVVRARLIMHRVGAPTANSVKPSETEAHKSSPVAATTPDPADAPETTAATEITANTPTLGARIEVLCLEPSNPADYERAFAAKGRCEWCCMVGNSKRWKSGPIEIPYIYGGSDHRLLAWRKNPEQKGAEQTVVFEWDSDLTFGQLLELLGRMPIPPYLCRDSAEVDNTRYQTVYARIEGSVAAPTAGLHFTPELLAELIGPGPSEDAEFLVNSASVPDNNVIFRQSGADVVLTAGFGGEDSTRSTASPTKQESATDAPLSRKIEIEEVTLHVGAGTFLPVKSENALDHPMHTERFEVTLAAIEHLTAKLGKIIAVGTTSVRTLESLTGLAWRIARGGGAERGDPETERPVGQFELYDIPAEFDGTQALTTLAAWMRNRNFDKLTASTRIMITPARSPSSRDTSSVFRFRIVSGIVTNFHQPKSTLLLLVSAFTGGDEWRRIYDYALARDFRFLSYGDSSLLLR